MLRKAGSTYFIIMIVVSSRFIAFPTKTGRLSRDLPELSSGDLRQNVVLPKAYPEN
jgi:hypothetical protein